MLRQRDRKVPTVHDVGLAGYKQFFPEPAYGRLRFEATTHLFYQETALAHFGTMQPQPLIVFVLRRPSERIRSSFQFTQENLGGISRALTFDDYVAYLLNGHSSALDRYFVSPSSLYIAKRELELNQYVHSVDRWAVAVGKEHLEVVLFEKLKQDPCAVVRRLGHLLGVDDCFWDRYKFETCNRSVRIRHQGLHRFAHRCGTRLPRGAMKSVLKRFYFRLQSKQTPKVDTVSQGIAHLDAYFAPWNRELAERFGVDISVWGKEQAHDRHTAGAAVGQHSR